MKEVRMKKALLLTLLLTMSFVSAMTIGIKPASAIHEAIVTVEPKFFDGEYRETKTFTVTMGTGEYDPIEQVVVTFPDISAGDTDYKPVDFYMSLSGWTATYEHPLRQVIFAATEEDAELLTEIGIFQIVFEEGPTSEDTYIWIVSTTDSVKEAHVYYPEQYIDRSNPVVEIEYPLHEETVTALWDWPDHYLWIKVRASDVGSGIDRVEIYIDGELQLHERDGEHEVLIEKKKSNLIEGWHNITAKAFDRAGRSARDEIKFYYVIPEIWIQIEPDKGTVGPTTTVDNEGVFRGSKVTYNSKTLGTEVTMEGGGFTTNSKVNVTINALLVVKNAETDGTGYFTGSFLVPTLPQGSYRVTAVDLQGIMPSEDEFFTVVPEIVYDPEIVIGPSVIEVIATGLPSYEEIDRFMIDGTDALVGTIRHVRSYWYTDSDGVLYTTMAEKPGFVMPVMEPGTYEITIVFDVGEGTFSVSNKLYVVNDFKDLLDAIEENGGKLDDIDAKIVQIKGDIAVIMTKLGEIQAELDDIIEDIVLVKGDTEDIIGHAVLIKTSIGEIKGTVTSIEDDVATIQTDVGVIQTDVEDISGLKEPIDTISSLQPATVALSLIAAISAIAAAVMVLRKVYVK